MVRIQRMGKEFAGSGRNLWIWEKEEVYFVGAATEQTGADPDSAAAAAAAAFAKKCGVDVAEHAVNQRQLFATIFSALGIDPHVEYDLPGLPTFHRVEEDAEPIREILA